MVTAGVTLRLGSAVTFTPLMDSPSAFWTFHANVDDAGEKIVPGVAVNDTMMGARMMSL